MVESPAMNSQAIVVEVRKEISRLQQVLQLLEGDSAPASGRGKGKRKLSKKARAAIAAAQRARWAKVHAAQKKKAA